MKLFRAIRLLPRAAATLALAALPISASWAAGCSKPITVGTGHWEPYAYFDARDRFTGMDVDMARAIFKEAGCVLVELAPSPPARNTYKYQHGEIDMMMGASLTGERLRHSRFSAPYRDETVGLFALAGKIGQFVQLHSFDALLDTPAILLAPRVGFYGEAYARSVPMLSAQKRLFQFVNFPQGVRMLTAGRADVIVGDMATVHTVATRLGVKVAPLPFRLLQAPVHLMLNRATVSEDDVRRLDAAIARLHRRGELERIKRSYLPPELKLPTYHEHVGL